MVNQEGLIIVKLACRVQQLEDTLRESGVPLPDMDEFREMVAETIALNAYFDRVPPKESRYDH